MSSGHLSRWWGPEGFTTTSRAFEFRLAGRVALEPVRAEPTQRVTHLTYALRKR